MSTRTALLAPTNNSDANFRLWINEVHNALIAFGWVQTSDTGQINFSTVTRPTTINSYPGYAMYKMGDSLQTQTPLYMRFDYGTGGNSDAPAIKVWLAIGSTDGAGNLTGLVAQQQTLQGEANTSTSSWVRTSGDSSSFRICAWITGNPNNNTTYRGFVFAIERDKDPAGLDRVDGVNYCLFGQGLNGGFTSRVLQHLNWKNHCGPQDTSWPSCEHGQTQSQAAANVVNFGLCRPVYGNLRNPMIGFAVVLQQDYMPDSVQPVIVYGRERKYLIQKSIVALSGTLKAELAAGNTGWAILWE